MALSEMEVYGPPQEGPGGGPEDRLPPQDVAAEQSALERLAAEGIEDVRRLAEIAVQVHHLIGAELAGPLETVRVAPDGGHVRRSE